MAIDALKLAKAVTVLTTSAGASAITKSIIDSYEFVPNSTRKKVLLIAGRWGIATAVGAFTAKSVKQELDDYQSLYEQFKEARTKAKPRSK